MLVQIVGEIVATMLGEVVLEALFPNWSTPQPPPEEGMWNASLGSVAAFVAAVAAMFGGISSLAILTGRQGGPFWILLVIAALVALAAGVLSHRTFRVTSRRHGLAYVGLWLSRATVTMALVALVLSVSGITFGQP
jgi:uncharacterized membrane protein